MNHRKPRQKRAVEYRRVYLPGDTERQRKGDAGHADALICALGKAHQMSEPLTVTPDDRGQITRAAEKQAIETIARKYREYRGRLRSTHTGGSAHTLLERCDDLAKRVGTVAKPRSFDHRLMAGAILAEVVLLKEACANPPRRGRGRPSVPKSPHGRAFIEHIAEAWELSTGRPARGGDGDTEALNFNNFLAEAFELAGVQVSLYSLPRISREVLD